jgi:uncharacterized protein
MPINLPNRVLPWQLAQSRRVLQGQVPFAQMPRLGHELLDKEGCAWVELAFDCDEEGRYFVQAHIKACLHLTCQRCLQAVSINHDTRTQIGLMVNESEIQRWPDQYEPWIVKPAETASLWNLVEEELLLALPVVVRHPIGECPKGEIPDLVAYEDEQGEKRALQHRSSPFSILKKFKIKGNGKSSI